MDQDAYPDISKMKILSTATVDKQKISLGILTLGSTNYFALYRHSRDILELTAYNKKYLFKPTDMFANKKYILSIGKESNMFLTLDKNNQVICCDTKEKGEYGVHFK